MLFDSLRRVVPAPDGLTVASRAIAAQRQPQPPNEPATSRRAQASPALYDRRRHAEPLDAIEDRRVQLSGRGHLGHLEDHVARVGDHLRSDLDQLLPQRRQ